MSECTVDGVRYTIGRLSAFDQFHVARKLGVVLLFLGNAVLGGKLMPSQERARAFAQAICSMAAPIPHEDCETALNLCLAAVKRDVGHDKGWAPIMSGGRLMYADIEMPQLLELVWHVLEENRLHDFFAAPRTGQAGPDGDDTSRRASETAKTS